MWAKQKRKLGFTIVELLIVIVVIGILAAITIVAFNGVQDKARDASAKSGATQAYKKLETYKALNGAYPSTLADAQVTDTSSTTFTYATANSGQSACVAAQTGTSQYSVQNGISPLKGGCGQVVATYYSNVNLTGTPALQRSEDLVNNQWGGGSPDSSIPADNFSAQYKTKVIPPVSGTYTFYTNTDDSAELIVNGSTVIPWTAAGVRGATSTTINLTANQPAELTYSIKEIGGNAYAMLYWSYPGQTQIIIPSSNYVRI